MKKLVGIALAVILVLALAVPVLADSVSTGATVNGAGGTPPIVKAKWETPDDGDPTHVVAGTQVLPNVGWGNEKAVQYLAVVTDPAGVGTVDRVYADVWHPEGQPECGSFKYQLQMYPLSLVDGLAAFEAAITQGLITYSMSYDVAEVREELIQGEALVFSGQQLLNNCQPAGDYRVQVKAYDKANTPSIPLVNYLQYIGVTAAEFDFTAVAYGPVDVGTNKWIGGNTTFASGDNYPTVRNIGNTWLNITIKQDDMGMGLTSGIWNVNFDARLGHELANAVYFNPAVAKGGNLSAAASATIPYTLELCETQKMDFSIHVVKSDPGSYTGTMILGSAFVPFTGDCQTSP